MKRSRLTLALPCVALLSACGGGSSSATPVVTAPPGLRVAAARTGGGAGDALAASLWVSSGAAVAKPGRPTFTMRDGRLVQADTKP